MSIDYAFWAQARDTPGPPKGLIYLLLCAGAEIPELSHLDVDAFLAELDRALPHRSNPDSPTYIELYVQAEGFIVSTWPSTTHTVMDWFRAYARRHKLVFFDPQTESTTETERRLCRDRTQAAEAADHATAATLELPGLLDASAKDNPAAQVDLAHRYYFGEGVTQDLPLAFRLYLSAAEHGSEEGMFNVASCFQRGEGTRQNTAAAIHWFEAAALTDHLFAPFALGELLQTIDPATAIRWFRIALEAGHQHAPQALRALGDLPPLSPPEGLTRR